MIDDFIKSGKFPPVLLLFGEEDLLVEENADRLFREASKGDVSGMSSEILDGEGLTLDAVLSVAKSYPMMSDRRVLWVKRFDKVTASKDRKGTDKLSQYLTDPMQSTFLLLTASLPSASGLSSALKRSEATTKKKISAMRYPSNVLLSHAAWMEFPQMKESQIVTWLQKRAAQPNAVGHSFKLSPPIAEFMVTRSGTSLRELSMELDKLSTYLGSKAEATEDDVLAVVGSGRQFNVFELQRAVGKADVKSATNIVAKMLEADRQELLIITMLTRYFTSLFKLIDCRGLSNSQEIAKLAGIPPFAVGEYMDALGRLGPMVVDKALTELRAAERSIKSSSMDSRMVLQIMLAKMFDAPARP